MASDGEVISFALRRLAEEVVENRPKMAARMRSLAARPTLALSDDERALLLELVSKSEPSELRDGLKLKLESHP